MDDLEQLKQKVLGHLRRWEASRRRQIEIGMAKAMFRSVLTGSPVVAQFSAWLLGLSGAAMTLIVGNLDAVQGYLSTTAIRWGLFFMLLSALCGVISLLLASFVRTSIESDKRMLDEIKREQELWLAVDEETKEMKEIADQHGWTVNVEANLARAFRPVFKALPWFASTKLSKNYRKLRKDELFGFKQATRHQNWQFYAALIQVALFMLAFITLIANI